MSSLFSTALNAAATDSPNPDTSAAHDGFGNGFEVVAGDYMPNTEYEPNYHRTPYSSKPFYSSPGAATGAAMTANHSSGSAAAGAMQRVAFYQSDEWLPSTAEANVSGHNRYQVYGHSPVSDTPSYDDYDRRPMHHRTPPPPPPPPLPPRMQHGATMAGNPYAGSSSMSGGSGGGGAAMMGMDSRIGAHNYAISAAAQNAGMNPYTYRGPNADYSSRKQNRLHQDFKALPKEERQRLVEKEAATSDLLARTVHLRFLPLTMLQSELADICTECGEYLRVRICGNSTNNQNWIYGFVEFATTAGAEAMMRRSGMELSNGPGRPPLRLKCNCAKQPIVDRVFHDADPATGNPCIFGLGNFAKRSLGDALESYYNLKEKEAQQLTDMPGTPSSALQSPGAVAASRPPMRLSPHARAFQPASVTGGGFGAELLPGVQNANAGTPNSAHWSSPATPATAIQKADSESNSSDSQTTGVSPTAVRQGRGSAAGAAAGSYSSTKGTPLQAFSAVDNASALSARSGGAGPQFSSTHSASDRFLSPDAAGAMPHSNSTSYHQHPQQQQQEGTVVGGMGGFAGDFLLPPSKYTVSASVTMGATPSASAAPAAATAGGSGSGGGVSAFNACSTTSDVAGSELSLALQNMMLSRSATDGEEVLERGQELTLRAIGQAHDFLNSQQGFYDAMGTLRSLVELLDCHAAVTGGAAATGAGDHTAELPQRATQLRLLANLMMALLYMMKRNLSEALPYIHAVVMSCNEIPVVCLWKASGQHRDGSNGSSSNSSSSGGEKSTPLSKPAQQQRYKGLAVGDALQDTMESAGGYDCFGGPADFLEAVLESIRDEEEEEEAAAAAAAAAATAERKSPHGGAHSVNGDTASTSSQELQALLRRDQAFHRYVLNVLVAIGLSMEEVQPVITRSTYALAAGRAKDVLNTRCEDLDECLESTQSNPRLSDRLYAPPLSSSSKRDITFFPRLFFTSAESMRKSVAAAADKELFWKCLPPKQCVECYVE